MSARRDAGPSHGGRAVARRRSLCRGRLRAPRRTEPGQRLCYCRSTQLDGPESRGGGEHQPRGRQQRAGGVGRAPRERARHNPGGCGGERWPRCPTCLSRSVAGVIAVTAVDRDGAVFPEANRGDYIAFAAPGVSIWVPGPDGEGRYQTGTSFAAPFALGTAALEVMRGTPPNADALRRRLAAKAHALGMRENDSATSTARFARQTTDADTVINGARTPTPETFESHKPAPEGALPCHRRRPSGPISTARPRYSPPRASPTLPPRWRRGDPRKVGWSMWCSTYAPRRTRSGPVAGRRAQGHPGEADRDGRVRQPAFKGLRG